MQLKLWLIIVLRPSRFGIQVCSFMFSARSIIHSKASQPPQHPMGLYHMKVDLQCQSHMSVLHAFLLEHLHWVFTSVHNLSIVVLTLLQSVSTLSAAFMGYQVVRQPLWIEGKDIQQGVKVLSGPFDLNQISSHVIPETARPHSDPCYNAHLVDLPETTDSSLSEEVPDMHITYCTTLAVESKLKKTSIPENVILGNVREMTKDDDAILEDAADTTAKQLADGWLTWANTQQPPTTSQAPKNTEQKHCDLASCAPKQWQFSVQTKEMEASGLNSSILSPFCDALPEFDCQGP